jgi:hypothetical protein
MTRTQTSRPMMTTIGNMCLLCRHSERKLPIDLISFLLNVSTIKHSKWHLNDEPHHQQLNKDSLA